MEKYKQITKKKPARNLSAVFLSFFVINKRENTKAWNAPKPKNKYILYFFLVCIKQFMLLDLNSIVLFFQNHISSLQDLQFQIFRIIWILFQELACNVSSFFRLMSAIRSAQPIVREKNITSNLNLLQ